MNDGSVRALTHLRERETLRRGKVQRMLRQPGVERQSWPKRQSIVAACRLQQFVSWLLVRGSEAQQETTGPCEAVAKPARS
jgi:hypothetical protein